ncbi:hypothetical protein J2T57_001659 [Natronocella acetinitrilica]|uniref:Uncharacterized protein n=1 Tax=Natronocella acetinitrilica TaxID=414046 RepID=A0AAE3KFX1_9GAMM|nr:hypothetical protein [Natronocella acetinitrilica]MCP1674557.1 hypothetical protein [Natronocella acetinitrilica]
MLPATPALPAADASSPALAAFAGIRARGEDFLHGRCHVLAIALAGMTRRPIRAMVDIDIASGVPVLTHAYIAWDEERGLDAGGLRPISEIEAEFASAALDPETIEANPAVLREFGEGSSAAVIDPRDWARACALGNALISVIRDHGLDGRGPGVPATLAPVRLRTLASAGEPSPS